MGNRSSSASKQTQNGINGKLRSMNGALPAQDNDISNRTQYDRGVDQRPRLNLRTYRSFSPADQSDRTATRRDIRLHRRSFIVDRQTGARSNVQDGNQTSPNTNAAETTRSNNWATRTLPRSFGHSRSAAVDSGDSSVVRHQSVATDSKRRQTLDGSVMKSPNVLAARPLSSLVHANDDPVEFPDCQTVRHRTAAFQQRFVEHFMSLYSSLPSSVQTSALSVAVHRRSRQHVDHVHTSSSSAAAAQRDIAVSLRQYLDPSTSCADVPLQLPASEYALTVCPAHFDRMQRARVEGCTDPTALSQLIVTDVAREAATELARAFEYQLILLGNEESFAARVGAQRAAERAMEYLKSSSRHIDVNSLIRGVVEGRPLEVPATVSAFIGRYELHWNIDDMFLRPGLRRERLLVAGGVNVLDGYGIPWRLYASTDGTDTPIYGYRGHLLMRDFHSEWLRGGHQPLYRLDFDEEAAYDVEVPWRPDDFHRTYRPYRRLVGSAVMTRYSALPDNEKSTVNLGEFVHRLHGDAFRRDEIEPVFRPLTSDFCREEFTLEVRNSIGNSAGVSDSTPIAPREFSHEERATCLSSMLEDSCTMYAQSPMLATEHCRQEFVPSQSSTLQISSPRFQTNGLDRVPVGLTRPMTFHGLSQEQEVSLLETNSATDACNQNKPEVDHNCINIAADQRSTAKRRHPPPTVKPKPSIELRRRQSGTIPTASATNSQTMTSLPVTGRQNSAPVDGSDSAPEVTVRFPTLEELFGHELATMRHTSTDRSGTVDTVNIHPASTLQHTGSTNMTSSEITDGDRASQRATALTSDI